MSTRNKLDKLGKMMEEAGIDAANVIVAKPKYTLKPKMPFMFIFPDVWSKILSEFNLTMTDMRVLIALCQYAQFQNSIGVNQKVIANDTGISKANVSRSFKKLFEYGLLFKDEKEAIWINPIMFAKGTLWDFHNNEIQYKEVENVAELLGLQEPPF